MPAAGKGFHMIFFASSSVVVLARRGGQEWCARRQTGVACVVPAFVSFFFLFFFAAEGQQHERNGEQSIVAGCGMLLFNSCSTIVRDPELELFASYMRHGMVCMIAPPPPSVTFYRNGTYRTVQTPYCSFHHLSALPSLYVKEREVCTVYD